MVRARRDIQDLASVGIHRHLALNGMTLLLATVTIYQPLDGRSVAQ
jgi:hypothetical protein